MSGNKNHNKNPSASKPAYSGRKPASNSRGTSGHGPQPSTSNKSAARSSRPPTVSTASTNPPQGRQARGLTSASSPGKIQLAASVQFQKTLLKAARDHLSKTNWSTTPDGDGLKMAQVALTAKMAKELNEDEKTLKQLNESERIAKQQTHAHNAELTSADTITTSATDHDRANKDLTIVNMPPLPMSPPPEQMPQSYASPPALPSVAKWLFKDHDFLFSTDRAPLEALLRRANAPIDYSEDSPEDLSEEIHPTLLATLDPLTQSEVHKLAHELQTLDALIIESKTKLELMENPDFIAKVTRTKSKLLPHGSLKDDPQTASLVEEFTKIHRTFQEDGTNVVKRYVELEWKTFHKKLIPTVLQGLFRLSKRMVADRKPQLQVNNILNMASLNPRANEEIPESNETLAGYILMLLLTSPSSHVLVQWTGLDDRTGAQDLFERALKLHSACPTPLSTPKRVNRKLLQDLSQNTAQDADPSQDIANTADLKPAAITDSNDGTKQGDGDDNSDEHDLYPSQTTNEESHTDETPLKNHTNSVDTPQEDSSNSSVTMIGTCYFHLPSENGMQVVLAAARTLQPIVNYITLQQRIQLARRITKSKCLVAAKELHLKREMFNATNSVKDLVSTLNLDSSRVLAVLTTWRRTFFDQLTKRMNKQLAKKTAKYNNNTNAGKTGSHSYHAPPRSTTGAPATVDLSNIDEDDAQDTPSNKRKKPPVPTQAKRAKNAQDEQPAALQPSTKRQQQGHDDPNAVTRKPPPTGNQAQRHVRIKTNDNESQHNRRQQQQKSRQGQRKPTPRRQQPQTQQQQQQRQQQQRQQQQLQRQQQSPRNNRKQPPPPITPPWPAPPKPFGDPPPTSTWGQPRKEWGER
jgi:hypothetical protein